MSGHSKWHNIQGRKNAQDAKRGKIFQKISRELFMAAKQGGSDPNNNPSLRLVMDKARAANMPKDNVKRALDKADGGDATRYDEVTYEGYGPAGIAILVEALTDNKNRTAGDVRHLFDKFGGSLGNSGCVSYMFKKRGVIDVDVNAMGEDDIMMLAIDAGADDIVTLEDVYEIYTMPGDMSKVREALENAGIEILSSEIDMIPDNEIEVDPKHKDSVIKLIDKLEELDDVQDVFHNAKDLSDDEE